MKSRTATARVAVPIVGPRRGDAPSRRLVAALHRLVAPLAVPLAALSDALSARVQRLARVRGLGWLADARMLVTIGLVSMVVSAHLGASWIGLLPDSDRIAAENRAALAEMVAAGSMSALAAEDPVAVADLLQFALERNGSMRSAAIRRADGTVFTAVGPHETAWTLPESGRSTATEIAVPLYAEGARWGRLEVAFEASSGVAGTPIDRRVAALVLIALGCFGGFYLYLGRMLQQLDPSRAVPDRVRNALDTLAEGLMLVDGQGRIVLANASLCEMLGSAPETLAGRPASALDWYGADGAVIGEAALPWSRALLERRTLKHQPVELDDASGERRSFLANCAPVGGDGGAAPAGVLVSLDDITELQRKEMLLREATERAEQANRAKSDFLANMSHEIRTPMNAILGFTEMLRRGRAKDASQARRHLDTVHASGSHLLALINDILDLSKVEAGQLRVERIAFAPHRVIADVVEALSMRAGEKGIGLRREVDGPVPHEALGDPSRLRQVVTNLVGNAIKFTERGEVVVTESFVPASGDRPARLTIAIRDTGIGIPADKLQTIFDPFVQADSSTARRFGGTGLGLAISRRLSRAMGGDVEVASEPGRGSTFTVTIDPGPAAQQRLLAPAEALAESVEAAPAVDHAWRFPPRRLLVVDDSAENRELVVLALQDTGLIVEQADSGLSAIAAVEARVPDMILMDMQMPGIDGYTATRRLRAAGLTIPIYAFTARVLGGFDRQIEEAGCDGYLTKPVDIESMLETLAGRLGGVREAGAGGGGTDAAALLVAREPVPVCDPLPAAPVRRAAVGAPVRSRLADNPRYRRVVTSFAHRLPERVAALRAAFEREDLRAFADIAHWLKGSAGSVGYDAFTAPARDAEAAARSGNLTGAREPLERIEALAGRVVTPAAATTE